MRRIIYFVATSLDGYLAREDGGIDWLFHDQEYGFTEFFASIDTVLQGRKTYELALTFDEYPYTTKQDFIFSRRLRNPAHGVVVTQPIPEFVAGLKAKPGKDIWLVGGGELAGAFFAARAIDTLAVYVHPILLGRGRPFAANLPGDVRLALAGTESYDSGLVRLSYAVNYTPPTASR
jgi:dihydrofolate reductase